jgi:hypothetical protein
MNKTISSILLAGLLVLLASVALMYGAIFFFPTIMEEYYQAVFRSSAFETDWLFYVHPFILSAALKLFWERFKNSFSGSLIIRAEKVAFTYGAIAILPVLWLTFSAIDISLIMVLTWLVYGVIQSFIATLVFAWKSP